MVQRAIRRCAICAAPIVAIPAQAAVASSAPTVPTTQGVVRGFTGDGAAKFLGLPYAAPPVGTLRWRAPQPAARWHGVRSATSYGNRCPQLPTIGDDDYGREHNCDLWDALG
jgi:para-nitrobenzyl esterase